MDKAQQGKDATVESKEMKFRIHDGNSDDSIVIEGGTIEELQAIAKRETEKRGWKDCWSEKVRK